jgi:hypothetical protein
MKRVEENLEWSRMKSVCERERKTKRRRFDETLKTKAAKSLLRDSVTER